VHSDALNASSVPQFGHVPIAPMDGSHPLPGLSLPVSGFGTTRSDIRGLFARTGAGLSKSEPIA
jgi:hypothetical protein